MTIYGKTYIHAHSAPMAQGYTAEPERGTVPFVCLSFERAKGQYNVWQDGACVVDVSQEGAGVLFLTPDQAEEAARVLVDAAKEARGT